MCDCGLLSFVSWCFSSFPFCGLAALEFILFNEGLHCVLALHCDMGFYISFNVFVENIALCILFGAFVVHLCT